MGTGGIGREPTLDDTAFVPWKPSYRLSALRPRPAFGFEEVTDPADVAGVLALLSAGRPPAVRPEDAATGPGSDWIMLPFIRVNPKGTRFTDGTFGAYYAGHSLETAVLEAKFHRARFLARTPPPAGARPGTLLGARVLLADVEGALIDLRGRASKLPQFYAADPAAYGPSQRWARRMWSDGAGGVVYDSVRHRGGECVAVFRPRLISNCRESHQIAYEWDGTAISHMHLMRPLEFDQ